VSEILLEDETLRSVTFYHFSIMYLRYWSSEIALHSILMAIINKNWGKCPH
jgi:hypothetical protein